MRRIIALVLTVVFSLQTTASAAVPGEMRGPNVQPLLSAIQNTFVFALITGQADRYEAMHAPAPRRLQIQRDSYRPDASRSRFARAIVRYGERGRAPAMSTRVFSLRDAPRDPLAMKPSNPLPAPVTPPARVTATGGRTNALSSRVATPLVINNLGSLTPHSFTLLVGQSASYTLTNDGLEGGVESQSGCSGIATFVAYHVDAEAVGSCSATLYWTGPSSQQVHGTASVTVTAPTPTPTPVPTPTPTPRPTNTPSPTPSPTPTPTPVPTPTPIPVTPTPVPTPTASPLLTATTGVNSWWTYEEKPLAGVGKAMVNVGNGNLLVQSDDIDIPERGIDLAFRRTYNSQSQHDASGTDGATPSLFGNGWTNTFDTHLAYNGNIMSVYDLDGARYDFAPNGSGGWTAPPGMQGTTLVFDGNCGYQWTKKTGTVYWFFAPYAICGTVQGQWGRLFQIIGRNHTNYIVLSYSFCQGQSCPVPNANSTSAENTTAISVQHSDGQSLQLAFSQFGSSEELSSITRPDNQTITYNYDTNGNLIAVSRPGNATDDASRTATIGTLEEQYWYYPGTHEMQGVGGPRYVWDQQNTPGNSDGSYYQFAYSANTTSGEVTALDDYASINFTPNDGSGQAISGASTGYLEWHQDTFSYSSGSTSFTDTDQHNSIWTFDSSARVTETQDFTNVSGLWLVTQATWDANNDLTSSSGPNTNPLTGQPAVTTYTYDVNGNTLTVQKPEISTYANGTGTPTSVYTYDQYNNLVSYCDAVFEWPSGNFQCGQVSGATYYVYNYSDTNEPYGQLTNTFTPLGYERTIAYNQSSEGGDYGLPTSVTGASYTQNDTTVRMPTQTFTYDAYGNLATYNKGNGAWTLTYDSLNRNITRQDPDGVTSYICYNPDNTVWLTRSAAQYAADGSAACTSVTRATSNGVSYTFDPDGNTLTELHHHACQTLSACQAGLTSKWYDGEDRLVEVRQPQDGNDAYAFPWMTRYIYDVSGGQTQTINGGASGFFAYGNLYKTQECIQAASIQLAGPATSNMATPAPPVNAPVAPAYTGGCTFLDIRGNTFDAMDRSLTKYEVAAGASPEQTSVYDTNGQYGFLSEKTNPTGQTDILSYNGDGSLSSETFSDGVTPNRNYYYDPDGREVSLNSATMGTQTRTYDADSRLTSTTDPSSEIDPGTITYGYYPDGERSSLSLSVPAANFSQSNLYTYNYRPDGLRSSLVAPLVGVGNNTFAWTYSNAGRELTQSDPFNGTSTFYGNYPIGAKTMTYDSYGRVSSLTLPREMNPKTNIVYDLEDHEIESTWGGTATTLNPATFSYQVTTRNEISGVNQTAQPFAQYANGANCQQTSGTCSFDARSGQLLEQQAPYSPGGVTTTMSHTYGYDAAGRQIADTLECGTAPTITATRSYDTDNHIITQAIPALFSAVLSSPCGGSGNQQSLTYAWGADGKLANFAVTSYYTEPSPSQTTTSMSAHWDGDDLLYVGTGNGTLNGVTVPGMTLYIEKLGWLTPGVNGSGQIVWSTRVYDRDQSGTSVNTHGGKATNVDFTQLALENVHPYGAGHANCKSSLTNGTQCNGVTTAPIAATNGGASCAVPPTSSGECTDPLMGAKPTLDAGREDGYYDGTVAIQGVRAYDPNMNQWTTPDAYSGDVHDPMSQHPYMWNANNPVQYSDPSGFDTIEIFDNKTPGIVGHAALFVTNGQGDKGTYMCWCGAKESKTDGFNGPASVIITKDVSLASLMRENGGRYDTGSDFHTTTAQDKAVLDAFPHSGDYNLLSNNCAQVCSRATQAAGVLAENSSVVRAIDAAATGAKPLARIDEALRGNPPASSGGGFPVGGGYLSSGGATTSASSPGGPPQ